MGGGMADRPGDTKMTDDQWIRLELKNAEARRHPHSGEGITSMVARMLHRLRRHHA
jgi:hypothetical protein